MGCSKSRRSRLEFSEMVDSGRGSERVSCPVAAADCGESNEEEADEVSLVPSTVGEEESADESREEKEVEVAVSLDEAAVEAVCRTRRLGEMSGTLMSLLVRIL